VNVETKAAQTKAKDSADIQAELDERFAKFGLRPLTDADVWALSMAAMVMPDGNPGAEAYLAQVAGTPLFCGRLTVWGRVVAIGVASARYKAPGGHNRRAYVEGYDESWGRYAVADGLTLALYGYAEEGLAERCRVLKCGKQGYQRIRDFVGGALVNAIAEYRVALEWATGSRRDRVLAGRWEGITGKNWDDTRTGANMGHTDRIYFPLFAPGCTRIVPIIDQADAYEDQPETLYRGLRPTDWWDESVARQMRKAPVTMIYPATD
jgi:hypothetical protein